MGMGYEGLVRLNVDGVTEDAVLSTGASIPKTRVRLDSSAGYGGEIKTAVAEMGIGLPRDYDFDEYNGSINFELTEEFYDNQINEWIFDRQKAAVVNLKSREGNVQTFSNCYWNNISLTTGAGAVVTGSIGVVAIERNSYTIGGDYIDNKEGDDIFCSSPSFNVPDPLNPSGGNMTPIPFWNTSIVIDGSQVDFTTWTVDLSQEVVKFFSCEVNSSPVEPRFVAVGPMTVMFSGEYMFVDTATFLVPDTLSTLTVNLAGTELKLATLEGQTSNDDVQAPDAMTPIAVEYAAFKLVA